MELPLHVLINPDSPHYDREDGKVGIEEMEKEMTLREMLGAMHYNIFKVNWRLGEKDDIEQELRKIETYENYLEELQLLLQRGIDDTISVARGWELISKKWRYK